MMPGPAGGFASGGPEDRPGLILDLDPRDIDLSEVQRQFEQRLDDLLQRWADITASQRDQIIDQVQAAIRSGDLAALARMSTSTAEAVELLVESMSEAALEAAQRMSSELADQGVDVEPTADTSTFSPVAGAVAVLLAQGLTNAAAREALRHYAPGVDPDTAASAVREHLESLSSAFPESNLGALLTAAQNAGRTGTALAAPSVAIYASEVNDARTCGPCSLVDGKWLGNSDDPETPARIDAVYPNGGYRYCEGGVRCRGTVAAVYRPEQATGEE